MSCVSKAHASNFGEEFSLNVLFRTGDHPFRWSHICPYSLIGKTLDLKSRNVGSNPTMATIPIILKRYNIMVILESLKFSKISQKLFPNKVLILLSVKRQKDL